MDKLTKEQRSANMASIRSKDMKPEKAIRSLLYRLGYRFRIHRRDLPGTPDIVLPSKKIVIFVNGCFWHQHPDKKCLDSKRPKSNTEYWNNKLSRNIERDKVNQARLAQNGWRVLVIWECESKDIHAVTKKITDFLANA